jgi:hypothetical protein
MLIHLNYNSVNTDFNWIIRLLNSVETKNQMNVVLKCFELWEVKHVKKIMSPSEKVFINNLRIRYWALFKTKNAKFILTSYLQK